MALYIIPFPFGRCAWRGRGPRGVDVSGDVLSQPCLGSFHHSMYLGETYTKAVEIQRDTRFRDLLAATRRRVSIPESDSAVYVLSAW